MRTRNYFKYLLAAIVAIGTSVNGLAQEKNLRLYFNEYTGNDNVVPQLILKGDVPEGVAVTQEGYKWAGKYLATAFNKPNCEDRVWADKDGENRSHATLSFTNFKYEVKEVKWNRMNDVFSTQLWEKLKNSAQWNIFSAIGNFLSAFQYDVAFTPADVEQPSKSVTSGSWFVLGKQMSFAKASLISNANLAGLKSISLEEHYAREQKLEDYCRIFLKAGVKGEAEPSTNDYAFQVTYYEPTLAYTTSMPSNMVVGDQKNVAYQITHAGAFEFDVADYTYSSSNTDVIEVGNDGVIKAKAVGEADITMSIKSKDGMVEKSVTKKVEVYSLERDLKYYHHNNNQGSVKVSLMNHQDNDYIFSVIAPDKLKGYTNGFTLVSKKEQNFSVAFLPFALYVSAPKYTNVTPSWEFNIENSRNNDHNSGQANRNAGMEVLYLPNGKDYNRIKDINVNTKDDQTTTGTNSIIKKYNTSKIENESVKTALTNIDFLFDNHDKSSFVEKQYAFAAIAYKRSSNGSVYSDFRYKETTTTYEYFAYINFVKDDNCPFTMPDNQTITSLSSKKTLNKVDKQAGYVFLGWSTVEGSSTVDYANEAEFDPYDNIDGGGKGPVTLYPVWDICFDIIADEIRFKDMDPKISVSGEDLEFAIEYAENQESGTINTIDMRSVNSDKESTEEIMMVFMNKRDNEGGSVLSSNALLYMNSIEDVSVDVTNVIFGDQCPNLYVTDRVSMKIPYEFTAQTATYERNGAQKSENGENSQDAMWAQSYKSVWGTLCLPYPITNNHSYRDESGIDYQIRFYELYGTHDNYMQFREMAKDQVIKANTPVLYCRTAGKGSDVTVQESNVDVPTNIENGSYTTNPVIYSTELEEEVERNENAERVVEEDWQFKGTLETKKFCTKAYSDLCIQKGAQVEFLAGAEVLDPDKDNYRELYYFKQDKFTHMTSGVTILPYRAYFDRKKIEESTDQIGESKVSSYSILVMDDDGTTTDITNLIDNHEAKGNGKIYDLSGRRVKQPVKGSIYIVDGKKKMY